MSRLDIYQDSLGRGTCRSCGARITWAELTSGRRMPFEGWDLTTVRTQGDLLGGGRVIETVDTSVSPTHWERCPEASQHRKR
jgi:hypothetical protein